MKNFLFLVLVKIDTDENELNLKVIEGFSD